MSAQECLKCGCLILDDDGLNGAVNDFSPGPSFWCRRATIVEADNHVSGSGCDALKIILRCPLVEHGLRGRLPIHKDEKRIFLRGIKMRRLHHPAVQRDAVAYINLKEFGRSAEKHRNICAKGGIIFQYSRGTMSGEFYKIGDRRYVGSGILVECPARIRGNIVIVRPG